ncbi:MAG: SMP-30/gluconolactonase/LRE family protein [Alphaproteobacteria bacterium]
MTERAMRLRLLTVLAVAGFAFTAGAAEMKKPKAPPPPSGEPSVIGKYAKLEVAYKGGCFVEGPAAAPDGSIYFTDLSPTAVCRDANKKLMQAGHILRYDPASGKTTVFRSPSGMANGLAFDRNGHLIVAEGADFGGRRITRTDMKTGKSYILAASYMGKPLNAPNDLTVDKAGRIYFTDPRYLSTESVEQDVQGVYRIDTDGSLHRIIADTAKPNGVAVAPDGKTLYVVVHDIGTNNAFDGKKHPLGRMAIWAYPLKADGSVGKRKLFHDFGKAPGADGIAVDQKGNLYAATWSGPPGVQIFNPQGKRVGVIPVGIPSTNVGFGRGKDANMLYITTVAGMMFRIRVVQKGYRP